MSTEPPIVSVERLVWDPWNVGHIAHHGVRPQEVEEVCHGSFVARATYGYRILLIGRTHDERALAVVLEPIADRVYYVVTARPASRKERRFYQEAIT